jgi:hypothetical protein
MEVEISKNKNIKTILIKTQEDIDYSLVEETVLAGFIPYVDSLYYISNALKGGTNTEKYILFIIIKSGTLSILDNASINHYDKYDIKKIINELTQSKKEK